MPDNNSVLVIVHYEVGMHGFPVVYVSAPGAVILSVDENSPGDRVFQCTTRAIPADLLASLEGEQVHHTGDDPGKDARARAMLSVLRGEPMPGPRLVEALDERP